VGIFNVASGNFTVGDIAEKVKAEIKIKNGADIPVHNKNISDKRNYKVSCSRAKSILGFEPQHSIESIVDDLYENMGKFSDFDNPNYYNIRVFKTLTE
jgi:nucleoside-diphosphate-sugar epimerase